MRGILIILSLLISGGAMASSDFYGAMSGAISACSGIGDSMSELKKMAGINTAITGVGTAAGVGATVTGFVKTDKDKQAEELEELLEKLRQIQEKTTEPTEDDLEQFQAEFNTSYNDAISSLETKKTELDKLEKQSKALGNWRTGLLAGSTVTNVAGAVIAGGNKIDMDLDARINACKNSINVLRNAIGQARIEGTDVSQAQRIVDACGEWEFVDLSKIDKRAKGAQVSAMVGAATGAAGTVTSAMANTDATRDDNTDAGKKKEKNLNTAANVLSIGTTAASATATIFNATQISAIKKAATVADNCEKELAK